MQAERAGCLAGSKSRGGSPKFSNERMEIIYKKSTMNESLLSSLSFGFRGKNRQSLSNSSPWDFSCGSQEEL